MLRCAALRCATLCYVVLCGAVALRARRGGRRGRGGAAGNGTKALRGAARGKARPRSPPVPTRRDAEDAVYGRDGYDYDGYRLRVEFPRSGRGTGRGGGGGGGGGAPRGRYGPPSRRSEYRVIVSGESRLSAPGSFRPPCAGGDAALLLSGGAPGAAGQAALGRTVLVAAGGSRPPDAVLPAGEARAIGF